MSRGIGVCAELVNQDEEKIIYKYGSFNWNREECKNLDYEMDGSITLYIRALPEFEFHNRNNKKRNSQKGVIKKVIPKMTTSEMLSSKNLIIANSKYSWHFDDQGVDMMAIRAASNLISQYEKTGEIPERTSMLS